MQDIPSTGVNPRSIAKSPTGIQGLDEITHGGAAQAAGAANIPTPARELMRHAARVMTRTAYWL